MTTSRIPLLALSLFLAVSGAGWAFALAPLAVEPWAALLGSMIQIAATVNVGLLIAFGAALYDFSSQE